MPPILSSLDNSNQHLAPLHDDISEDSEDVLTIAEAEEFRYLETRVEECLKSFWEIGRALARIRDERLYRENYKTFEEYCMTRWEMSRRSAYQLIDAAVIYRNISENIIDEPENVAYGRQKIQILPANERQIRPLVALSPKQQQEAWNQVVSTAPNGKVTAVHVACVVNEYRRKGAVPNKKSNLDNIIYIETEETRSCWNCSYCSKELPENPQSFYCNKLGELSLLEKNGNERGAECQHWNHRNTPAENKSQQPETFNLNIQLPSHLQPLIQDAARASGLVISEWVAKAIQEAITGNGYNGCNG